MLLWSFLPTNWVLNNIDITFSWLYYFWKRFWLPIFLSCVVQDRVVKWSRGRLLHWSQLNTEKLPASYSNLSPSINAATATATATTQTGKVANLYKSTRYSKDEFEWQEESWWGDRYRDGRRNRAYSRRMSEASTGTGVPAKVICL